MEEKEIKNKIIKKIFRGDEDISFTEEIEVKYPPRKLKEGAMVTRVAPSPTGPMHVGTLYMSLISERFAHQTDGVFYLRIEDTDKKREVEGATELIPKSLKHYGIKTDEGQDESGKEIGGYGPYKQSNREHIYKTYIKSLLEKNLAYPCFCSPEEMEKMREKQEALKIRPGYYGKWAKCRDMSPREVLKCLDENRSYVIRFKSSGDFENKIFVKDLLKGERELSENDQDIVIMKSDGLPTYHLGHVVDDHLMGTTHVLRGDEWLSSLPLHLQLFETMGWVPPLYGHIAPIQKLEGTSKRKLSKRKDPEANVNYYDEQGYPKEAVIEYLLNLANSNFEDWRRENKDKKNTEFHISFEKLAHSNGALFDFKKLDDISREIVSRFSKDEIYANVLEWAEKYDREFKSLLTKHKEYAENIFNIERGDAEEGKRRKDLSKWSEVKWEIEYFFDVKFSLDEEVLDNLLSEINVEDVKSVVSSFLDSYKETDSKDNWLAMMRKIVTDNGYAESAKAFKIEPTKYKGHLGDVARIFRVLLTNRMQTPDLYEIMQVMGKGRIMKRLTSVLD